MGYYGNPYGSPEKFGLKIVSVVGHMDYDFNMCVVWQSAIFTDSPAHYYGFDSGCSCPSPFENIFSIKDLHCLRDFEPFEREVTDWGQRAGVSRIDVVTFLDKVHVSIHMRPTKKTAEELDGLLARWV